jgi:hypothetical protein
MKAAYNLTWLNNLVVIKEAKRWMASGLITKEQLPAIVEQYPSKFYHPNVIIRILLFIACAIVLGAITGLLILMVIGAEDEVVNVLAIIYGLISLFILDRFFIRAKSHYKSGITEALLYHSILFIVIGAEEFLEFRMVSFALLFLLLFSFTAYRYLDLISTVGALCSSAYLIFYLFYQTGGFMQQLIPIAFIIWFTPLYLFFKKLKQKEEAEVWREAIIIAEAVCLLFIYAAGNYLVVREVSVEFLKLEMPEGQDIPMSFLFYTLTILIPILYLYFGIKNRDLVLIRVSLVVMAFSVFTFKYYYSTGHHEITLTTSGLLLLIASISLLRWLKTPKGGYTRENILNEKWANSNAQAFIISQTLGATKASTVHQHGGGESGGGGAESRF